MISTNSAWNLVNFRSGLIRSLIDHGYQVVAVAPNDSYSSKLAELGCYFIPLRMDNKGTHIGRDFLLFWNFLKIIYKEGPALYLGFTIKPNIYGSFAARILCTPVINNIAGLGAVFARESLLNRLVRVMYRFSLAGSKKVFFQNREDLFLFVSNGLVSESVVDRLPGSGIDLKKFSPSPLPNRSFFRFLLIARMLWDKGVGEYISAARILRKRGLEVDICLLGFLDVQNPTAISKSQMDEWVAEGVVRYLGVSNNVCDDILQADCIVLPSYYREGTPRCLLEAAAMGRPIITTNSVGCRDVVDDGLSGLLCRPKDDLDLAEKMVRIMDMSYEEREAMGRCGREKVEREFDEKIVIKKYIDAISLTLEDKKSSS